MLLHDIVETSSRVAETRKRLVKIEHLSRLLERLEGEEIEIAICFLSGILRQGSIGIGPSVLRQAMGPDSGLPPPIAVPELTLRRVDDTFTHILEARGKGSARAKLELRLRPATGSPLPGSRGWWPGRRRLKTSRSAQKISVAPRRCEL